MSKNTRLLKVY